MPKSSPASSVGDHRRDLVMNGPNAGVLKRNQACHQCRKRKLKCDAKRPCSTCVRSHNHAVAHARPDALLPQFPECTFDELRDPVVASNDAPKSKYEKLESRINELEALLRQKNSEPSGSNGTGFLLPDDSTYNSNHEYAMTDSDFHLSPNEFISNDLSTNELSGDLPGVSYSTSPGPFPHAMVVNSCSPLLPAFITSGSPELDEQLVWSSPPNLPDPLLLKHLIDVFFLYHPYANRLFHRSSFLYNLSLPHTHPKYPCTAILHAICALSSRYTSAVTGPPFPDPNTGPTDDMFSMKARAKEHRPDSFAEQQANHAKQIIEIQTSMGDRLLETLQAIIILTWYNWSLAKWVDVFLGAGLCLRSCVPLGINICPPFFSMQESVRVPSILPPAKDVLEDELRRNIFFISYALDRQQGVGNGWATSLDDCDITQLLPVRGDHFDNELLVRLKDRQWFHQKDVLLNHPEGQTDSFVLMIKSCLLISKVKTFNLRYRARYYAGDPSVLSPVLQDGHVEDPVSGVDPRRSPAFIELDHILTEFRASFPAHLKHPIMNNVVDVHLYSACLAPLLARIVLHEPHTKFQPGCISAQKILTAAQQILDLIYAVWSSSFDIALLDLFCAFSWYTCGRIFARFIQASQESSGRDATTFRTELQAVQVALAKLGERVPLAFRYYQMLIDFTTRHIRGPNNTVTMSTHVDPESPDFYVSIP